MSVFMIKTIYAHGMDHTKNPVQSEFSCTALCKYGDSFCSGPGLGGRCVTAQSVGVSSVALDDLAGDHARARVMQLHDPCQLVALVADDLTVVAGRRLALVLRRYAVLRTGLDQVGGGAGVGDGGKNDQ